ncbi:hypothetical protein GARC_4290 [Paraglaciecola arctica BSs20135]|uniref:Uncharacterized protein n=1 Tax=Paraglaciecola arctica BSs20135 TaxID=493475 RepID=K6YSS9_9ALTE|nr:hypothetical protein GARC_4290 [Paraglaciecola arctica BSs20135]
MIVIIATALQIICDNMYSQNELFFFKRIKAAACLLDIDGTNNVLEMINNRQTFL